MNTGALIINTGMCKCEGGGEAAIQNVTKEWKKTIKEKTFQKILSRTTYRQGVSRNTVLFKLSWNFYGNGNVILSGSCYIKSRGAAKE
jgi:hypothetical protein